MIGIVIVTHNSESYIDPCLRSVFAQEEKVEVVVIDNASKDESVELVRKHFSQVKLVENEENVGFAKAANQGIRLLLEQGAEMILLLNPDTRMGAGAITEMKEAMQLDPKRGVVQPLLVLMKDPEKINTWGNEYRGFGVVSLGGYGRECTMTNSQCPLEDRQIQYASGACMLVRAEVFEEVGLLDERFFLYFEDTEFSQRVRHAGYECWLAAKARVQHDYHLPLTWRKLSSFVAGWAKFYRMVKG